MTTPDKECVICSIVNGDSTPEQKTLTAYCLGKMAPFARPENQPPMCFEHGILAAGLTGAFESIATNLDTKGPPR